MNFGIIGGGMIARFHAQALRDMDGGRLHSVFARRREAATEITAEFGGVAFDDLDAFLADPELHAVTIATPSGAHLEPALAAIRAGKHVACEKPLEVTLERLDQLVAAAQAHGVKLAGIFNRRFAPAMAQLKHAVEAGRFGRLVACNALVPWWRSQAYYDSAAWRGTWALDGGGALMNQGIHTVDQLLWLAGPVRRVSASVACLAHKGLEVEDTAAAILEFENGARGTILASTACWSSTGHSAQLQLFGTRGSAILADTAFRCWDFDAEAAQDEEVRASLMQGAARGLGANDPGAIDSTGHQRTFEDLARSVAGDTPPAVDGREARKAVALVRAIYGSAAAGGAWMEP